MKATTIPAVSGIALTAIVTAGLGHWWSVHQISTLYATSETVAPLQPNRPSVETAPATAPANLTLATQPLAAAPANVAPSADVPPREFYETLIARMESIQTQNRDLLDQLAETNRDLMKLEFRVDTHSESFRPLPVSEDLPFTRLENDPGVLPPRAEPVMLPSYE